jgi:hypothetical protein
MTLQVWFPVSWRSWISGYSETGREAAAPKVRRDRNAEMTFIFLTILIVKLVVKFRNVWVEVIVMDDEWNLEIPEDLPFLYASEESYHRLLSAVNGQYCTGNWKLAPSIRNASPECCQIWIFPILCNILPGQENLNSGLEILDATWQGNTAYLVRKTAEGRRL